jgi:hypothetical protein
LPSELLARAGITWPAEKRHQVKSSKKQKPKPKKIESNTNVTCVKQDSNVDKATELSISRLDPHLSFGMLILDSCRTFALQLSSILRPASEKTFHFKSTPG